jgi:uncharacterized membrane protein YdfJ with MMPL/SSD domain
MSDVYLSELIQVTGIGILLIGIIAAWMAGLAEIAELYGTPVSLLAIMATGIVLYGIGKLVKKQRT